MNDWRDVYGPLPELRAQAREAGVSISVGMSKREVVEQLLAAGLQPARGGLRQARRA
jgi:hypothetical protein